VHLAATAQFSGVAHWPTAPLLTAFSSIWLVGRVDIERCIECNDSVGFIAP
jgi:hypothetical protein